MADRAGLVRVGWRERVELPAWGVVIDRAKIDTGARTSALHVATIEEIEGGRVRFEIVVREAERGGVARTGRSGRETAWAEAVVVRWAVVKPSSGRRQRRPVVRTTVRIGEIEVEGEVGLVRRRGMLCPMLVGRTMLRGLVVVDPRRTYVRTERPERRGAGSERG